MGCFERTSGLEKALVNKYLEGKIEDGVYESLKKETTVEKESVTSKLQRSQGNLELVIKQLEQVVTLASNLLKGYTQAPPELQKLLLKTLMPHITVKDGAIIAVRLQAPLDELCSKLPAVKRSKILFETEAFGEPR